MGSFQILILGGIVKREPAHAVRSQGRSMTIPADCIIVRGGLLHAAAAVAIGAGASAVLLRVMTSHVPGLQPAEPGCWPWRRQPCSPPRFPSCGFRRGGPPPSIRCTRCAPNEE